MRLKQGCSGMWIAALAAVADQITKSIIRTGNISFRIGNLFLIREVENSGVAFSMLSSGGIALTIGTALIIAALVVWLIASPDALPKYARTGMWMIAGGGLGNLYDRIFNGCVTDFIEPLFVRFAVFNVADIAIVCGAMLAAAAIYIDEKKRESAHERKI